MISMSDTGGLYQSTPVNYRDAATKAFMYACDRQIAKLIERSKNAKVWCNIANVDEKYLDYMAADCRALFYNSALDAQVKRQLIANSSYWYMHLGTSSAMEEMINIVFSHNDTTVEEWYTYAGEPYHFRIGASSQVTTIEIAEFLKYINEVKNARSIFDSLVLQSNTAIEFKNEIKLFQESSAVCGDFSCGTYPDYMD
nr:MAG TPA: tail protein [Caudoviricetes sp.]